MPLVGLRHSEHLRHDLPAVLGLFQSVEIHIVRTEVVFQRDTDHSHIVYHIQNIDLVNTPPETVPLDRTNGALRPLKWCMVTAVMVH